MNVKKLLSLLMFLIMFFPPTLYSQDTKKIKKYFKMDLKQLLNIVMVTAGKKEEKVSDIPANVVLVTREDIETAGYQDLEEVLESVPGLYIIDDYLFRYINVRGFWSYYPNRKIKILVNGIPYMEGLNATYAMEFINVPVEAIDRIEVIKGPMSVVYGDGAFFGVINIVTNKLEDKAPANRITASYGSEKTGRLFARTSGKSGDFSYVFNGSYLNTDGINMSLEEIGGPNFQGLTTEKKLERSIKYFNFSGTFKNFNFDATYSENRQESMFIAPSVTDGTLLTYRNTRLNIGYKKKFSDTLRLEAKLVYFLNRMDVDYDILFEGFYGTQKNESSGIKGELNMFFKPSSKLDITVGLDYLRIQEVFYNLNMPLFGLNLVHNTLADGNAIVNQSIFAQLDYSISDKLKIVAGAMIEQTPEYTLEQRVGSFTLGNTTQTQVEFSQPDTEIVPRFALIYSPNNRNVFKFLYGEAFNRPSFFENVDLLNNPDLPPLQSETIRTVELNYIGHPVDKITVNLSVFKNWLDNLIYRTLFIAGDELVNFHANVGEMTTTGVEFTLQSEPFKSLRLELSGTYQDTKDKRPGFEDIDVGYSPKFLGYFKASYFFNKNISLAFNANYVGEMEPYYDETLPIPERLGEKIDGYFLLGANLRIRNLWGTGIFINLRCSNLLDEELRYPATPNNFQFAANGTRGRGRSILFTLGWKF